MKILAVHDVAIAVAFGDGLDAEGVGAGVGLGDGEHEDGLAGDYGGDDVALLLVGAVLEDAGGVHGGDEHEGGEEAEGANVLEAEGEGDEAGVVAAVLLGDEGAEEADVGELLPEFVVELVVAMGHLAPLFLLVFVAGEHLAHGGAEELVFFAEGEI